jgi:hypothetical protein
MADVSQLTGVSITNYSAFVFNRHNAVVEKHPIHLLRSPIDFNFILFAVSLIYACSFTDRRKSFSSLRASSSAAFITRRDNSVSIYIVRHNWDPVGVGVNIIFFAESYHGFINISLFYSGPLFTCLSSPVLKRVLTLLFLHVARISHLFERKSIVMTKHNLRTQNLWRWRYKTHSRVRLWRKPLISATRRYSAILVLLNSDPALSICLVMISISSSQNSCFLLLNHHFKSVTLTAFYLLVTVYTRLSQILI